MTKKILISETEKKRIKELYTLDENKIMGMDTDAFLNKLKSMFDPSKPQSSKDDSSSEKKSDSTDKSTEKSDDKEGVNTSGSDDFMTITKKVIDNFEGGYWNYWECKNHPHSAMFNNSGETMFGLDRKAGNIENISSDGKEFFRIIDSEKKKLGMSEFCKKWKWGYKGGDLENKLKDLAAKIMKSLYEKNMNSFVKNPETKKKIESNKGLILHMSYATWNGPGFFKKFAKKLDDGVSQGKSIKELVQIAKDSRTASLGGAWAKGTQKVNNMIDKESGLA
jgi:hypothetical protein